MRQAVLALDLGTCTGWALLTDKVEHGHFDVHAPAGRDGLRTQRLRAQLHEFKRLLEARGFTLSLVLYETIGFAAHRGDGFRSAHLWGGFWLTVCGWCEHHGIRYLPVNNSTAKKQIAGNGNCKKAALLDAVRACGFKVTNHNESDALAVLMCSVQYQAFAAAQKVAA